jgi:hypothetical protein
MNTVSELPATVSTIPELVALPDGTVLRDRMGWVTRLAKDVTTDKETGEPDGRGAYMANLEGVRVAWSHHLPMEVLSAPNPNEYTPSAFADQLGREAFHIHCSELEKRADQLRRALLAAGWSPTTGDEPDWLAAARILDQERNNA